MKVRIKTTTSFKSSYALRIKTNPRLAEMFRNALKLLQEDPTDSSLRFHKLQGSQKGLWSFTVDKDCRVICKPIAEGFLLLDIGTHAEVYLAKH